MKGKVKSTHFRIKKKKSIIKVLVAFRVVISVAVWLIKISS